MATDVNLLVPKNTKVCLHFWEETSLLSMHIYIIHMMYTKLIAVFLFYSDLQWETYLARCKPCRNANAMKPCLYVSRLRPVLSTL